MAKEVMKIIVDLVYPEGTPLNPAEFSIKSFANEISKILSSGCSANGFDFLEINPIELVSAEDFVFEVTEQ